MEWQIVVSLRFVHKKGHLIESFLGIENLIDINSSSLKSAIKGLFSRHGLSLSRLRGQGYTGLMICVMSLMVLKKIIFKEIERAYCVHCFTCELQVTIVNVALRYSQISMFFNLVVQLVIFIRAPCKQLDILQEKQKTEVIEALNNGELPSDTNCGETNLICSGDTLCGVHYGTLSSLTSMFSSVIDVLEMIRDTGLYMDERSTWFITLDIFF